MKKNKGTSIYKCGHNVALTPRGSPNLSVRSPNKVFTLVSRGSTASWWLLFFPPHWKICSSQIWIISQFDSGWTFEKYLKKAPPRLAAIGFQDSIIVYKYPNLKGSKLKWKISVCIYIYFLISCFCWRNDRQNIFIFQKLHPMNVNALKIWGLSSYTVCLSPSILEILIQNFPLVWQRCVTREWKIISKIWWCWLNIWRFEGSPLFYEYKLQVSWKTLSWTWRNIGLNRCTSSFSFCNFVHEWLRHYSTTYLFT